MSLCITHINHHVTGSLIVSWRTYHFNKTARKRTPCDYGLATSYRSNYPAREDRVWSAECSLASSTATSSTPKADKTFSLTDPLSDITSEFQSSTSVRETDPLNRRVHAQVYRVIKDNDLYVDDVTSKYFNGVNKWLPIISRPHFNRRMLADQRSPSAVSAILLLSMALVSQTPSSHPTRGDNREVIDLSTKMIFAHLQACAPPSLCLIQAALLISPYERSRNLLEAAYVSIGTCARMAFAIGLHLKGPRNEVSDREAWPENEEAKNVWWGIIICDR
jgi:hypothetical protein